MKKYLFTLLLTLSGLIAFAQSTQSKSEKISFSTHETDTQHILKASFSKERAKKVQAAFLAALGDAKHSSAEKSVWIGNHYTASLTTTGFKANLEKEDASAKEIAMFKQLSKDLHKALGQTEPPQAPTN